MTVQTPGVFHRAADWALARDFGCPVGISLRRVLLDLTGPPRVGACTLAGPLALPRSWGRQVREVRVAWPALSAGVDAIILVHPGPLNVAVRSRIDAGPQAVLVVDELPAEAPDLPIPEIRDRILTGELHALAARHPDVSAELRAIAAAGASVPAYRRPQVAVISPQAVDPALQARLGEWEIVDSPHVDAVLAVAPPAGWAAGDEVTLHDAWRRTGRLVSTAPLPSGVPGVVVPPGGDLTVALRHALSLPVAVPELRPGAWLRALERLDRHHRVPDGPAGAGETAKALLLGLVAGLAVGRGVWTLLPAHPVVGVLAGMGVALGAVGVRWWVGRREAARHRAHVDALRRREPAVAWLRRQLAKET